MAAGTARADGTPDVQRLIDVLNAVIVTEIACYLRYSQHALAAAGLNRARVVDEFAERANDVL